MANVFARRQVRHALIGGLAVGLRGRPRATKDADFILHVAAVDFPGLLEELAREGFEIDLIRREWSAVADGEEARTAWLEDAIKRFEKGCVFRGLG